MKRGHERYSGKRGRIRKSVQSTKKDRIMEKRDKCNKIQTKNVTNITFFAYTHLCFGKMQVINVLILDQACVFPLFVGLVVFDQKRIEDHFKIDIPVIRKLF